MKRWPTRQSPKSGQSRPSIRKAEKPAAWSAEKAASVGLAVIGLAQIIVAGAQVMIADRQTDVSERLQLLEAARSQPRFFPDSTISAQFRFTQPPRHIRLLTENVSGIVWVSAQQLLFGAIGSGTAAAECTFMVPRYFDTIGPNIRESWAGQQIRLNDRSTTSENSPSKLWVIALTTIISISYRDIEGNEGEANYSYVDGTMMQLTEEQFAEYEDKYPTLDATRTTPGRVSLQMKHLDRQRPDDDCTAFMHALGD